MSENSFFFFQMHRECTNYCYIDCSSCNFTNFLFMHFKQTLLPQYMIYNKKVNFCTCLFGLLPISITSPLMLSSGDDFWSTLIISISKLCPEMKRLHCSLPDLRRFPSWNINTTTIRPYPVLSSQRILVGLASKWYGKLDSLIRTYANKGKRCSQQLFHSYFISKYTWRKAQGTSLSTHSCCRISALN